MTLRRSLGVHARRVYDRLEEVLDSDDGLIVLVDRLGATSYLQGFALSGCQLERLSVEIERAIRVLAPGSGVRPSSTMSATSVEPRRKVDCAG